MPQHWIECWNPHIFYKNINLTEFLFSKVLFKWSKFKSFRSRDRFVVEFVLLHKIVGAMVLWSLMTVVLEVRSSLPTHSFDWKLYKFSNISNWCSWPLMKMRLSLKTTLNQQHDLALDLEMRPVGSCILVDTINLKHGKIEILGSEIS